MKRLICIVIPLVALGTLIGWRLREKKEAAAAQTQQRAARTKVAPLVSVAPAEVRDVVRTFESVGTVEAPFNVKIAPRVTGRILFLEAREGDRVRRGQELVRIDPADIQAQVDQKRAALAEAQHRLAQARIAENPTEVGVGTQVRQQEAALSSAEANLNQVTQNYESQVAAAESVVTDVEGRVASAKAQMANAEAAIRSATANLENARTAYNRVNDLYKQGYIAAQDVDNARTAVSVQQSALEVARGQLNAATAARDSALAQKQAAEKQVQIVKTKGKADIEAARAQVAQVRAALDYAQANTATRSAYKQNLAALEAGVSAARASLANTTVLLSETVLKSPIDGFVTARAMDPGAVAMAGQAVLTVQDIRQVWVTLPVPQEMSRRIATGTPGTVSFDALPGRSFHARVTQVNPAADPLSRQFSARLTLDNPGSQIKPGMFARVTIETERARAAVVVPPEAIRQEREGSAVVVVDETNTARVRPVKLGLSDTKGTAVTEGLRAGEKVVVMSAFPVRDGTEVRLGGPPGGREGAPGRGEGAGPRPGGKGPASGSAGSPGPRPDGAEPARGSGPPGGERPSRPGAGRDGGARREQEPGSVSIQETEAKPGRAGGPPAGESKR